VRQKDFDEVARVIGNEFRTCDIPVEGAGLLSAHTALMGHAKYVYPEVDLTQMHRNFLKATSEGM